MGRNGDPQFFFSDLETIRIASLKAGLPFIQIILVTPHWYYTVHPDTADIRWQVYTTLAYGAHGIMQFTYWPVLGTPEANPAIVDGEGKPTPEYQIVRDINLRLQALAPTLVKLRSVGVYHTDPLPHGGTMWLAFEAPVKQMEGGGMVLGWLKDEAGNDFIFLVNCARRNRLQVRLKFEDRVREVEEISESSGKPQPSTFVMATHLLATTLEAGEGRLFQLAR